MIFSLCLGEASKVYRCGVVGGNAYKKSPSLKRKDLKLINLSGLFAAGTYDFGQGQNAEQVIVGADFLAADCTACACTSCYCK